VARRPCFGRSRGSGTVGATLSLLPCIVDVKAFQMGRLVAL
jgi:hypothetical protein